MTASVQLAPLPKQRFTDNNGNPLVGGLVFTYAAGTTTKQATYTDSTGATPNTNPVVLDARGEASIWLDQTLAYKVTVSPSTDTDPPTAPIWTVDNIPVSAINAGLVSFGVQSYPANTVGGALFTTVWGDGVTDQSANLLAANALGFPIRIKGVLVIGTPTTITVPIVDTTNQIFSATSQVTIANGLPVRPEWFGSAGGNVYKAAKVLPQPSGGVVLLREATYAPNGFSYNGTFMDVPNVTFRGARMPQLANDCKSLTGGTIIQGAFIVFADNVAVENIGFDSGNTFTGAGSAQDAFAASFNSDAAKTANTLHKTLRLHNVIGLCNGPNDGVHGIIVGEGYSDVTCTGDIVGVYGVHGVVIKCRMVKADQLTAYLNGIDGVIIKTDTQTSALSSDIQISKIISYANGPSGWSPYALPTTIAGSQNFGVYLHCYGGTVAKLQIGDILENGHATGFRTQFDGAYILDSLSIGAVLTDTNADTGVQLTASTFVGASMQRIWIGKAETRNAAGGMVCDWQTASGVRVGTLHAVNCSVAALATTSNANPTIDIVMAENCGAAYQITSTSKPVIGATVLSGTTTVYFSAAGSGQVPALSNGWSQVGGGNFFGVYLEGYEVRCQGLITPGTSNLVMTLPNFARPPAGKYLALLGRSGATQAAIPVAVGSDGTVTINDAAGGFANCSNYLSLAGLRFSHIH